MSSVEVLEGDRDAQDILSVNLTRAVQPSVDVAAHVVAESDRSSPDTMAEALGRLHDMGLFRATSQTD